jgi:enoyl-CoA hydratase
MGDVRIDLQGPVAQISLNRPRALHALTRDMCLIMSGALLEWREDDTAEAVLLDHADGRGFCAGGDVAAVRRSVLEDGGAAGRAFFHAEYRLNHLLFTCPKPVVAFMDGITMGGGVGLALPCKYRIATENTLFAMPEMAIGLFPDVGAGWYLSRLPGRLGQFLALTGARLDGAECMAAGLATHYIPSEVLAEVKRAIAKDPHNIAAHLAAHTMTPPEARLSRNLDKIERFFSSDNFEEILAVLAADDGKWAGKELATLRAKGPLACKVALRLLAEGKDMPDFASEMRKEYALACRIIMQPDFAEGVRAVLVDKDNTPKWNPASPEGVTDGMVDAIFAPLPPAEEWTPL